MDGIAPDAASSLRAHLIEVETCWLEAHCAACTGTSVIPFRMLVRRYGPDVEVGAFVARLTCKRCDVPPTRVRLKENPNDTHPSGGRPGWSQLLIERAAVSGADRDGDAARHPG